MAPRKTPSLPSPSPILIGNCEVTVESNKFTMSNPHPNTLHISTTKTAKIIISVRNELNGRCSHDIEQLKADEEMLEVGRTSTFPERSMFILVNSKYSDGCSMRYLQDILKIYTRELPTMSYAANTGKQSMFLERCVSNGKYCSLLLKSKSAEAPEAVIAAITYRIVPADTQYAEIPLAAVNSVHQRKGFGSFLYKELRKRLWSVGVRAIYCWGDEESEAFWHKMGFNSVAEVDKKGKARRLPMKADVRKALCFPGGSILMLSRLDEGIEDILTNDSQSGKLHFPLKLQHRFSSAVDISVQPGENFNKPNTEDKMNPRVESSHSKGQIRDEGLCWDGNCVKPRPFGDLESSKKSSGGLEKIGADIDAKCCSCYTQSKRKRTWEASLSSLKSKKVKGSHQTDCNTQNIVGFDSGSNRVDSCLNRCSLAIAKSNSFIEVAATDSLTSICLENNAEEGRSAHVESEIMVSKGLQSNRGSIRVMLMNIADDAKRIHLTKVIENLGGAVTPDGSASTHIVTGKVRTTLNFCTALCSGAWIVSSSWLKESFRQGKFVDESAHMLQDEDYTLKYRTELRDAVLRAKARPNALLKGYDVCIAVHVEPPLQTVRAIVKSAGGNIICGLKKINEASSTIYIACEEDMEEALSAAKKGLLSFCSEWLMNCIMRQDLDLQALQFAQSL
ncbi:uncharacterized protein LOC126678936 isoform X2 [Mercurialis annua]|uniref:uncharacterized protein LOC126678936 isoform X2 n=1 Tax=Mercurialis annua TaxID=3986 RepID=UPI0021602F1D|nr:uncharacterized protein LOC126678936 isoform X2 [Mercurialis annua]